MGERGNNLLTRCFTLLLDLGDCDKLTVIRRPHPESIDNDSDKPDWEKWRVWCVVRDGMRLKVMACGGVELKAGGGGEGGK